MLRSKRFVVGLCAAAFLSVSAPAVAQPVAITTPMISTNFSQTCAVNEIGTVTCSGTGFDGEFTVPNDLLPSLKVQTFIFGACALQVNGTVRCWSDYFGISGLMAGLTGVTDIAGNTWHMCAKTGDWVCSGAASASAMAIPATAKTLYPGWGFTCFIDGLDVFSCVGPGEILGLTPTGPIADAKSADVSYYGGCVVLLDGALRCFGNTPAVPGDLGPVAQVAVASNAGGSGNDPSASAVCAVLVSGSVRCWGTSWASGSSATDMLAPPAMSKDIFSITGTGGSFYVLHNDGSVTTWGDDAGGKLAPLQFNPVGGSSATAPDAPTDVAAEAGKGQVTVSWTAPANDGGEAITGYTVTSSPEGKTCTTTGVTSCAVTGLTNGTAYTFTVTATNSVGTSAASSASSSVTPTTVPAAPTNVSGVAGDGEATVSWTAPASDGGATITAYKATASNGEFCETAVGVSDDFYSCTINGLDNLTEVTFTVVATNSAGDSDPSEVSAAVIPHTADFQVWVRNPLLKFGQSSEIYVFGAQSFDTVALRIGLVTTNYTPDASGTIKTSHTADPTNGWDRVGYVSVKASAIKVEEDGSLTKTSATGMINVPRSYAPNRVRAFGAVKVASRAVPEGTTVSYQINGTEVCTADADDRGRTSCFFEAPEDAGDYTLETWIGETLYASNTVTVFSKGNAVAP